MRPVNYDSNKFPASKAQKPNQDKDFDTYSVQSKMSYQKQPPAANTTVSNNEKMTKSILESLKKVYQDNEKSIALTGLKANQKSLLGTISAFLHSFDGSFDENSLTIEMLPDVFKVLGYPNTISKTYFQPVGAPHTWGQCLAMMDWLGELASFHMDIVNHLQEGGFNEDFTSLLIRSYIENNSYVARSYLQGEIQRKAKAIQNYKYTISTLNLEMQNLKAAQKDIRQLEEGQKIQELTLHRETQEAIQLLQQNSELEKRLRDIKNKVEEQKKVNQMHANQIVSLEYEVQNQELSVEQVERIRFQIREYHQKITELKKFEQREKQAMDKIDESIVTEYMDFGRMLENLKLMYRRYRHQMDIRNIYLDIPDCDVVKFREFLKQRKQELTELKVEQMVGIKEVQQIMNKTDKLFSTVAQEIQSIEEAKKKIYEENSSLSEEYYQKQRQNAEQKSRLDIQEQKVKRLQHEINNSQAVNKNMIDEIRQIQNDKNQDQEKQQEKLKEAEDLFQNATELGEIYKKLKKGLAEFIDNMAMEVIDLKAETLEDVNDQLEEFEYLNEELGFFENNVKFKSRHTQNLSIFEEENQEEQTQKQKMDVTHNKDDFATENEEEKIELPRHHFSKSADDEEMSYEKIFGQVMYESPKPEKVNRMKKSWNQP